MTKVRIRIRIRSGFESGVFRKGASPVRERFERRLRTLRSVAQALALLNLQSENIDCKEGSINLSCEHEVSVGWQTD